MRNPDLENLNTIENQQVVVNIPEDLPRFDVEPYNLLDDKEFNAYIKDLKKFVRNSFEYKTLLIPFLRNYMGMDHCSYLTNLTNESKNKIKIEIHHDPLDLETICRVVFRKRAHLGESISIPAVAYEVLWCHFSLLVGLIPLSETVHELVHNGNIFINPNKVYGFYKQFINRYFDYFEAEELEVLDKIADKANQPEQDYSTLLQTNFVEVNMNEGLNSVSAIHQVKQNAAKQLTAKEGLKSISVNKPRVRPFSEPYEQRMRHPKFEEYWDNKLKNEKEMI